MKQEKWLALLGLANRAGRVITGEELVIKEIQRQHAKIVLIANDASDNTKKKIRDKCSYYQIPCFSVSDRYTLGQSIGKEKRVVVAVIDSGFANKLIQMLD